MMYDRGFSGGYGGMMGGGWFGDVFVLLFSALVIVGIVLLAIWAIRASHGHGGSGTTTGPGPVTGHDEAIAIAKRRLASGEINPDEYAEIVRALGA